jgi:hypothetical protein
MGSRIYLYGYAKQPSIAVEINGAETHIETPTSEALVAARKLIRRAAHESDSPGATVITRDVAMAFIREHAPATGLHVGGTYVGADEAQAQNAYADMLFRAAQALSAKQRGGGA